MPRMIRSVTQAIGFLSLILLPAAHGVSQTAPYTVACSPNSVTIYPGTSTTVQVQTSGTSSGPIAISFRNLPPGVTASPAPLIVNAGSAGTVTLTAAINADAGAFPANDPAGPTSHTTAATVTGLSGSSSASNTLSVKISLTNAAFTPASGQINLPIFRIDTNGVPIVDGTTDVPGTVTITSADGSTSYLPGTGGTDNTATFHLHGSTTAQMPKKPYKVKLTTSLDLLNVMGVTCPYVTSGKAKPTCDKSKSYILLANYDDKTLLRDWSASALANAIPIGNGYLDSPANSPSPSGTTTLMPWAPHSLFVELYVNNAYQGNYQLIEQVKLDSHRVNVTELTETDTDPTVVTGGYILEIDHHEDEAFVFTTPQGLPIGLKDPDFTPDPNVPQQTDYISNYVNAAETALYSSNFTDPALGWRAYFDEAAAVNFYIVNEVMGNVDGGDFYSSDYLYKDRNNPLLYMGPIWDFDISSGNVNYASVVDPTAPWMQTAQSNIGPNWYTQWFKDPGFKADVIQQWNKLKSDGVFTTWLNSINQQATALQQSQANNFGRWPILGETVWPNPQAQGSYQGEVAYLTDYLSTRIAWLDSQFNQKATSSITFTGTTAAHVGDSITFTAQVSGSVTGTPSGMVTFSTNKTLLGTAQLNGSGQAVYSGTAPAAGTYNVSATYGGDSTFSLSKSSSKQLSVSPALIATTTAVTTASGSYAQGSSASFTATISGQSGSAVPTGSVTFSAGIGTATLVNGVATKSTSALPVGSDTVTVSYGGDSTHTGSNGSITVSIVGGSGTTATPTFTPAGGTYSSGQQVTITDATPAAVIHYTTNGTTPTASSTTYSGPVTLGSGTTVLQALAVASGLSDSAVASATYTISSGTGGGGAIDASGLTYNGSAKLSGNMAQITDGNFSEAGSAWNPTPVNVQSFTTDFQFQMLNPGADGFTFTLQNAGTNAIGSAGGGLGYQNGGAKAVTPSVALKFDIYNNGGEGANSIGLYQNGASPTQPSTDLTSSGLNLKSGHLFQAHLTYDGTTLQVQLTDTVSGTMATFPMAINLPAILGANTAFAGFTGGTGGQTVTTNILNWSYSSGSGTGGTTATPTFTPGSGTYASGQQVTITDATAGAVIHYTTNGTTPTASSTTYSGPLALGTGTTVIKALAVASGLGNSAVASATYTVSSGTGGGDISASSLSYNGSAKLSGNMAQLTDGKINEAGSAWNPLPVNVQSFTTDFQFQMLSPSADGFTFTLQNAGIQALGSLGGGLGYGLDPSNGSTARITPSVALKFDIYDNIGEGGNSIGLYQNGAAPAKPATDLTPSGLNLKSGHLFQAHLTYDGTTLQVQLTDTVSGTTATFPMTVNLPAVLGANTAFAGFTGGTGGLTVTTNILNWSYDSSGSGTGGTTATPTFTPGAGTYGIGQQVTIADSTPGAVIHYTTNGTTPTASSTTYSGPLTLASGTTVIKAIAIASGFTDSAVASATYTVSSGTTATPTFTPGAGTYASGQQVAIADSTAGAVIHYTTNGTTPTASSTTYSGPLTLASGTTVVKAIATASGFADSAVASATYTVSSGTGGGGAIDASTLSYNGSAKVSGSMAQITDGKINEAGSAWNPTPVNVQSFTTDFQFQMLNANADGFTFTLQNAGTKALGSLGGGLGYSVDPTNGGTTASITPSVALKFDIYNNGGEGTNSIGLYQNGAAPTQPSTDLTPSGLNLKSGHLFQAHLTYDGTTLQVKLTDTVSGTTATFPMTVNLPAVLGANTAFAGFTGGTGGLTVTTNILNWSYDSSGSGTGGGSISASTLSYNGSAKLSGDMAQLTDGKTYEAGSAWSPVPVNVQSFTTDFQFQMLNPSADGFTFTLQNAGIQALGSLGGGLGYGLDPSNSSTAFITPSVAVKFDIYSNTGEGGNSIGLYQNGAAPAKPATDLTPSGLNLKSGDLFQAHLTYDGTTLRVQLTDTVSGTTATFPMTVNLPAILGANTAFAGFTGGTGGLTVTTNILNWSYASN